MIADKRLYFIPIIAHALQSDEPRRALEEAFEEINELGKREEYKEGFQQFMEFIKSALRLDETSGSGVPLVKAAIYRLLYDLATDTFEGDEEQRLALLAALRKNPEWDAEYIRIQKEVRTLFQPEAQLKIEVLRETHCLGSFSVPPHHAVLVNVRPGQYTVRFSNGRLLWEGHLGGKELIQAFAFPGKDLAMAAETEVSRRKPTRTISLLAGEIILSVFAGLEAGQIRIEGGKAD